MAANRKAIKLALQRANDRQSKGGMVQNNTVNPNRIAAMRQAGRPVPGTDSQAAARMPLGKGSRPSFRPLPVKFRPGRRPKFGPGSGRTGPGPR